jgi:hypothetical protein
LTFLHPEEINARWQIDGRSYVRSRLTCEARDSVSDFRSTLQPGHCDADVCFR